MVTYMAMPQNKLTLDTTELENVLLTAKVNRVENGWDTATIVLPDTSYHPDTVTDGTPVTLEVKDAGDVSYTTIFSGICRFAIPDTSQPPKGKSLTLSCLGAGFGLGEMLCGAEYGSQSTNSTLDTITEIINDATNGLVAKYVNKILNTATDSGFAYTTASVDSITDVIPYIVFPYKAADKCLCDLVDLVTALKAGSAGPHWIVTTDNKLRVKLVDQSQTGWTKYYGNSQANATLTYGIDYLNLNLEKMSPEAIYILYYGAWRRPSNGDSLTYSAGWGYSAGNGVASETTTKIVGADSARMYNAANNPVGSMSVYYPTGKDAAWDFSSFTDFNTPNLNFYVYYKTNFAAPSLRVRLYTDAENYYTVTLTPPYDSWKHYSIPIGNYFRLQGQDSTMQWTATTTGSLDWNNINWLEFYVANVELYGGGTGFICVDGLHFGDSVVCRVAWNSSLPGGYAKMRLITDDVGKDDSLKSDDDSGLMAQMAYAELLRLQTDPTAGSIVTPMIKDVLPGQWLYIQATDFRVTKLVHEISSEAYKTSFELTSDVVNGRVRPRYEDLNKQLAAIRPEWQDRQASNMKAGKIDVRVARLAKDYA